MALSTPVVSNAMMGTLDVLREGEGCLIVEENHDHFAAQVNRLLNDDTLRQQLAERALTYATRWHEDAKCAELVTLYQKVAKKRCLLNSYGKPSKLLSEVVE